MNEKENEVIEESSHDDAYDAIAKMMQAKKNANKLKKPTGTDDEEVLKAEFMENNPEVDDDFMSDAYYDEDFDESFTDEEFNDELDKYYVNRTIQFKANPSKARDLDTGAVKINKMLSGGDMYKFLEKALTREPMRRVGGSTFEIVLPQSGYSCKVAPLTNIDGVNILNTTNNFENAETTYKAIYKKIQSFSCGKMDYLTWLKSTSIGDLETFYYGIYCATFIDEGTFRFKCRACGKETEEIIRNSSLKKVEDYDDLKNLSDRIAKEAVNFKAVNELSLVTKSAYIQLNKSGLGMEIIMPTLFDMLQFYKAIDSDVISKRTSRDITAVLCIKTVFVPTNSENEFFTITSKEKILDIIDRLSISDASEARTAIDEIYEKNHVSYRIKSVKCQHCGKEVMDIPLDMRSILFTQISERR